MKNPKATPTLTLNEVKALCPTAFTEEKSPTTTTDKYLHIPTSVVIEDLISLGWFPSSAKEVKARKNVGYQKHLITFTNPNILIEADGDDVQPTILLTNSHDGKNAFHFRVGLIRFVCENGLVISDGDFCNVNIRHMGYTFSELQNRIQEVVENLPNVVNKINLFKETILTDEQIQDFAKKAIKLRFDNEKSDMIVDIEGLLKVERSVDEGNSLWVIFNRIQEKFIKGRFTYGDKNRKARKIKNFTQDIQINKNLWELSSEYIPS